jgi:hypothetical protein
MASKYPGSLDALTNPVATDPLNNPAHAEQHEDANDAIEAIQSTLGTNPEGGYATVDARLTDIASAATSASVFAAAAAVSASVAQGAEVDASDAANLAEDWAIQLVDPVSGGEYSAKFHAQAAATSATTITVEDKTADYAFVLGDAGKLITVTSASAQTMTIPPSASVAFPNGTFIGVASRGTGDETIQGASGVTVESTTGSVAT